MINAFIQSLVGLFDFASTGDTLAASLFRAGNAQAQLDLPRYNTGYWSRYDQYGESSLSYHELLIGFLANLCHQTRETTPAALAILGVDRRDRRPAPAGRPARAARRARRARPPRAGRRTAARKVRAARRA